MKFKSKNFNAVTINLLTHTHTKKKVFSPSIGPMEMLSLLSDGFSMECLIGYVTGCNPLMKKTGEFPVKIGSSLNVQ